MTWSCMRQCVTMRAPWVGQTDNGIYDHYVLTHSAIHIHACLAYISQSINQTIQTSIALMVSESDATHYAQRPPTTNVSYAMTACHQFDHRLIIGLRKFKDRLLNNREFHIPKMHAVVWCWCSMQATLLQSQTVIRNIIQIKFYQVTLSTFNIQM